MSAVGINRVPPHNLDAEQSIIGACLLSPKAIDAANELIRWNDFYREAHQRMFSSIQDLRGKGREVDVVSLADYMGDELERMGGKMELLNILDVVPATSNIADYCRIVKKAAVSRQLVSIGTQMQSLGFDALDDVEEAVGQSMDLVMGLAMANTTNAVPIGTVMSDLHKQLLAGKADFISPPGLPYVHLKAGDMMIVGAATSVGKTAVTMDWADYWTGGDKRGVPRAVTYFEYEMPEVSLASRLVAKYSGVTMNEMDEGLTSEQLEKVSEAGRIIQARTLSVENVYCDINGLIAKIRRAAQFGTEIAIIDHLGLVPFAIPSGMNHAKAVGSQVTNRLKRLATELNIRIILLCQFNRAGQESGWKNYPTNMALRDSGEIEQDASHIVLLYRYPRPDIDPASAIRIREDLNLPPLYDDDILHFGVTKNRNAELGGRHFGFHGATFTLTPLSGAPIVTHIAPDAWNEEKIEQSSLC